MVTEQQKALTMRIIGALNNSGARWCVCFGTLLSLIRDKTFNVAQDVDVGIIGSGDGAFNAFRGMLPLVHLVLDDATRKPLNAAFNVGGVCLDLFFWRKRGGCAYHCYDEQNIRPKTGILPSYHFKGVPASIFWPSPKDLSLVPKQAWDERRINGYDPEDPVGEIHRGDYTYNHPCPGLEVEGVQVHIPFGFGAALDYWYPGNWDMKDETYGVSHCFDEFTTRSCKGLWK